MNRSETDLNNLGPTLSAETRTEATMLDELNQIDTSPIDDLQRIKAEEDALQVRLDKMEEMKGKVSEIVFQRVGEDYRAQYAVLENEARPLKGRARGEYAKLIEHRAQLEAAVESARLDKEELDFRKQLGEFTDQQFKDRLASVSGGLKGSESHLEECDKLRASFLEAFHSEQELLRDAPAADATGSPPPVADTRPGEATAEVRVPPSTNGVVGGATMIVPPARLIVQAGDAAGKEIRLGLQALTIGRAADSGLRLDVKGVSRHHAEVAVADSGFEIHDSNSRKGLYVNGAQVSTRVLEDGDLIELGSSEAQLVFRSRS